MTSGRAASSPIRHVTLRGEYTTLVPLTHRMQIALAAGEREDHWVEDYPTGPDIMLARMQTDPGLVESGGAGSGLLWQILDELTGLVVGGAGVKSVAEHEAEIGYGLAPSARGLGHATRAVTLLVAHIGACAGVPVVANVDWGNEASARVLQRAGFAEEEGDDPGLRYFRRS